MLIWLLRWLPKKWMSRLVGRLAQLRAPFAVRWFAEHYQLNMAEAEFGLEAYPSLLALFTRRLKENARPLDPDPKALLSPADGKYLIAQRITENQLIQAKGKTYTVRGLIGDAAQAERYLSGSMITIYLSPQDYHRVHAPISGEILGYTQIPGGLFPVNQAAVDEVDRLFATNERMVTRIRSETLGEVAVVMVGATNVGRIRAYYDDLPPTNDGLEAHRRGDYDPPRPIERGDPLGVFELGSTVILLTERPIAFLPMQPGDVLRMGRSLGAFQAPESGNPEDPVLPPDASA